MERSNFELRALKVNSSGKVEIEYREKFQEDDTAYSEKNSKESPRIPHPDFTESLANLRMSLGIANELFIHRKVELIAPNKRDLLTEKEMGRILNQWDSHILESLEVTGISLGGDLETGWCVIKGKHAVHGTKVAMNTPKMNFSGDTFKIENEVKELVEKVIEEAYLYIFEKKGSQTVIEFGDAKTEEEMEPVNAE
jgi:hypothetical protein